MKAVLCPVCKGSGKYKDERCHGCYGRGWVQVAEDWPVCHGLAKCSLVRDQRGGARQLISWRAKWQRRLYVRP